ncbi:MAG: hypothetical protein ACLP1D_25695 [Xanthobacteraceae bacterium]
MTGTRSLNEKGQYFVKLVAPDGGDAPARAANYEAIPGLSTGPATALRPPGGSARRPAQIGQLASTTICLATSAGFARGGPLHLLKRDPTYLPVEKQGDPVALLRARKHREMRIR